VEPPLSPDIPSSLLHYLQHSLPPSLSVSLGVSLPCTLGQCSTVSKRRKEMMGKQDVKQALEFLFFLPNFSDFKEQKKN